MFVISSRAWVLKLHSTIISFGPKWRSSICSDRDAAVRTRGTSLAINVFLSNFRRASYMDVSKTLLSSPRTAFTTIRPALMSISATSEILIAPPEKGW